ncbi:DNA-processing protein DprA [Acidisoma silvae]|uniref:DNA-protecting protein DprA n=1 Tax=Acidisoma silvae TaxID=2802396 RepID=A0A963YR83_9PROT|nr:DNA-processing protein DprA [Acidisoma silvae]MCB8875638.1 DNA-protecting protein DprA [Acidisoma silvae]
MTQAPSALVDRIRLARTEGVGPIGYARLMDRFGSAAGVLEALPTLAKTAGRSRLSIPSRGAIEDEIAATVRRGGQFLTLGDAAYPPLLALLADAPPVLVVLGDIRHLSRRAVGMVGGRNASLNGQHIAASLAADLAGQGLTIVSGMARGIDAAAHEAALSAAGGLTIAAVATGIDRPYPPQHEDLQRRIATQGAVVTEAPLGTEPQARHFPRRNRIIAGLSLGVIVVEAARQSGSLITARLALEAGRDVFAVPRSPLDPRSQGSNDLIRRGAILTETAEDVVGLLPPGADDFFFHQRQSGTTDALEESPPPPPAEANKIRAAVLAVLGPAPTSVDDLLRHCQFTNRAALVATLLDLELGGFVESLPGNRVALIANQGG